MNKLIILLLLLPGFMLAQSQRSVEVKVVSLEKLELDEWQRQEADRIEVQYQQHLREAIKIIPVDRKEAFLKIALAMMRANDAYLRMLNSKQRHVWEAALSASAGRLLQKEQPLNSRIKSRTIALAVR